MNNLDLSVIILSYNTKDVTDTCLKKLKISADFCEKKLGNKVDVLVIDNHSEDGSVQMIKSEHPWVKLMALWENTGFSKGNNIGMEETKSPFILLLNSDVYISEETLYKTLAYFRVNLNCDVLGARLNYASGKLQPSSGNLPKPLNIIFWILSISLWPVIGNLTATFHPKDQRFFAKAHKVGWVMGAFFALKRKVFEQTGGFDENLFMHMEEVEWCQRIKDKGFKVWYVPQVEVVHLHGASSKFDLKSSFLNELRGIKYFLKKHYSPFYLLVKLFLILGLILRVVAFFLIKKTDRAKVYLEGLRVV